MLWQQQQARNKDALKKNHTQWHGHHIFAHSTSFLRHSPGPSTFSVFTLLFVIKYVYPAWSAIRVRLHFCWFTSHAPVCEDVLCSGWGLQIVDEQPGATTGFWSVYSFDWTEAAASLTALKQTDLLTKINAAVFVTYWPHCVRIWVWVCVSVCARVCVNVLGWAHARQFDVIEYVDSKLIPGGPLC